MSYLTTGWLCVITGSLFIAIGGFLITKGWDEFSNHSKRQTLLTSAMRGNLGTPFSFPVSKGIGWLPKAMTLTRLSQGCVI
jgi:hypothetical protein